MTYDRRPDDRASNPSSAPTFAEVLFPALPSRVGRWRPRRRSDRLPRTCGAGRAAAPGSPVKGGRLEVTARLRRCAGVQGRHLRGARGYVAEVLIPWGTPILSTGPAWRKDASNTAAEQAEQVGMHHDGMHFFSTGKVRPGPRGLLVLNHEYVDPIMLSARGSHPDDRRGVTRPSTRTA